MSSKASTTSGQGKTRERRRLCGRCLLSFPWAGTTELSPPALCPRCAERPAAPALPPPVPPRAEPTGLRAEIETWCQGRAWWARLPLLVYFAHAFVQHISHPQEYRSIFDALNLGIHELGHYVFAFGQFLTAAGGTLAQCLAPVLGGLMFYRQRDFFGVAVASLWLATNFFGVAIYVADARALQLTLVAPGVGVLPAGDGGVLHDWNFLLGPLGLLQYDQAIAWGFRLCGGIAMLLGLGFGSWLLWKMARSGVKLGRVNVP